jgi:hypothetical protein
MNAEDCESEEFGVSEAVGLAFHGLDLVIGAFRGPARDGVVVPGEDTPGVQAKCLGELLQHGDAGRFGAGDPVQEKGFGCFLIVLFGGPR